MNPLVAESGAGSGYPQVYRARWTSTSAACGPCPSTAPSSAPPELSHTQELVDASASIMRKNGVEVEVVRVVDHDIATGVYTDMTEHGWPSDDWPAIHERVMASEMLVVAGPIWLSDNSSITKQVIKRLYGGSGALNADGQYAYYGKVGGCLITGNEDGIKHCAQNVLYSLTSATPSRRRRTPGGSVRPVRVRRTSTREAAGRRTTSPTATRRS